MTDEDAEQEVGAGTGGHDDGALPHRVTPHRPVLVGRVDVVVLGRHPDDLHEGAGRDGLQPVLGLAPPEGEEGRSEADEVAGDFHAERLGCNHVSGFVQCDRDHNTDGKNENPD
jgi:hypothetical protein